MKQMLDWQGISRQGAHKSIARAHKDYCDELETIHLARQVRKHHGQMNCRDIYYAKRELMPRGRDWTEQVLLASGFRVKKPVRSFTLAGEAICSNLIEGLVVTGPNQVWQTDITYQWVGGRWYYISFVIDVYTRQIVAWHCSKDLSASSQVRCLMKAFANRKGQDLSQLIIHTDRGIQYTSQAYKDYLDDQGVQHSMAHYAWQNAYCERVNRTIKRNYLDYYKMDCFRSLCRYVGQSVDLYNESKPHRGLPSRLSPAQFAKELNQGGHPDYKVKIWSKLTSTKTLQLN